MIEQTLHNIAIQLEAITARGISIARALDLLEASTSNVEEIMAINIMRESLIEETTHTPKKGKKAQLCKLDRPAQPELLFGLA